MVTYVAFVEGQRIAEAGKHGSSVMTYAFVWNMGHVARCSGPYVQIEHHFDTSDFKSSTVPRARRNDNWEHVPLVAYF